MAGSINVKEIEHFAKDAPRWWDENGPFRPLHRLNPARLHYIRGQIGRHYGLDNGDLKAFTGLRVLDIGCGGGLVCEPMARLGADVTGIDADEQAIEAATEHAGKNGLKIQYKAASAEDLLKPPLPTGERDGVRGTKKRSSPSHVPLTQTLSPRGEGFDVVLALEIAEHVEDVESFVQNCVNLCKPGGIIIFSTLNRTPQSFALGIVAAEYLLRWVPRGTHQWKKFIRPSELARMVRKAGAKERNVKGLIFNPLKDDFELSDRNMSVNYFMTVEK